MKRLCLILLLFFFLPLDSFAEEQKTYLIYDGKSRKIPMEYLWYNEKLPGDLNGVQLDESTGWTPTRQTDRSYNKGFWVRYKLKNDTKIKEFGLDHENIFPRTIFVAKRYNYSSALSAGRVDKDGKRFFYDIDVVESPEERVGFLSQVTAERNFYDNYQVTMRKGGEVTVFEWIQTDYFNRWHGIGNPLERVSIQKWDELLLDKHKIILFKFVFTVFIFGFCVIFFIHLLLDFSLNYFWMFLTAAATVTLFTVTEIGLGFYMGMPKVFTISETYTILMALALGAYSQFVYSLLQSDEKLNDRRIAWFHYSYQLILGIVVFISLVGLAFWPSEQVTDLDKYPLAAVGQGPGFIPARLFFVSYAFWLFPMIVISLWCTIRRGIIALYAFIAMSMLLVMTIKYAMFMFVPGIDHEMLKTVFADEVILAVLFSMMAFTASARIRKTEMDYLEAQLSLKVAYARFVPEELTEHLNRERIDMVRLGDQKQLELSIMFSDIRGFTTLSEKMSPSQNFKFINDYMGVMTPVVKNNNGFVSAFAGDSIMALFDLKVEDAVETAIQMMRELRRFNHNREREGNDPVMHGIGIGHGSTVLGTLGDPERMAMTVISSIVNTSSRIESLTKEYKVPVLLSEGIVERLPENRYSVRILDKVAVKGQTEKTTIYELLDAYEENLMYQKQRNVPLWEKAYDLYEDGDHETAQTYFKGILEEDPDDYPAQLYYERCRDRRKGSERRGKPRGIELAV